MLHTVSNQHICAKGLPEQPLAQLTCLGRCLYCCLCIDEQVCDPHPKVKLTRLGCAAKWHIFMIFSQKRARQRLYFSPFIYVFYPSCDNIRKSEAFSLKIPLFPKGPATPSRCFRKKVCVFLRRMRQRSPIASCSRLLERQSGCGAPSLSCWFAATILICKTRERGGFSPDFEFTY